MRVYVCLCISVCVSACVYVCVSREAVPDPPCLAAGSRCNADAPSLDGGRGERRRRRGRIRDRGRIPKPYLYSTPTLPYRLLASTLKRRA